LGGWLAIVPGYSHYNFITPEVPQIIDKFLADR
jgi:hypothetical protein